VTVLVLRFPADRSQATPWTGVGGDMAIPPSPWRVLRALCATWRTRVPQLDETVAHGLLAALAVPPRFHVPSHLTLGPVAELERDAELAVEWPNRLSPNQHEALAQLAAAMPCFGRADSRCAGSVADAWTPRGHQRWEPLDTADTVGPGPVTSVLAVRLPLDVATLLAAPADARHADLPFPTGTRLVAYQCFPAVPAPPATALRLTFVGRRPPATRTVAVTDLLRRAALARLGTLRGQQAQTLLGGRNADASVARDQHAHTSYLPVLDGDTLAGLAAWTPVGLPGDEVKALHAITTLSTHHAGARLRIAASRPGAVATVAPALSGPSTVWTSATPYTPSRYPKKRNWSAFLFDDITRELDYRGLPAPVTLEIVDRDWRGWRRSRPSAPQSSPQGRADKPSAFLRLRFAQPVPGPLALGHLSHFGLGLFAPEG
jgi:CRISPR-associated protein Csb2